MHRRIYRNSHLFQLLLKSPRLLLSPAWDSRQCSGNTSQNLRPKSSAVNPSINRQLRLTRNLGKSAALILDMWTIPIPYWTVQKWKQFLRQKQVGIYLIFHRCEPTIVAERTTNILVRPVISNIWLGGLYLQKVYCHYKEDRRRHLVRICLGVKDNFLR